MFAAFLIVSFCKGAFGQVPPALSPASHMNLGPIVSPYPAAIPIIMTFNKSVDFLNPDELKAEPRPRILYNLVLRRPLTNHQPHPEYRSEDLAKSLSIATSCTLTIRIFIYDDQAVPDVFRRSLLDDYKDKNVTWLNAAYWMGPALLNPLVLSYPVIILPSVFKDNDDYVENIFASPSFYRFYMKQIDDMTRLEYAFVMFYSPPDSEDFEVGELEVSWSYGAFVCVPCSDSQPPFFSNLNVRQQFYNQPISILDAEDGVHLYTTLQSAFSDALQNGKRAYWVVKSDRDERLLQDTGSIDTFDRFHRTSLEHSIFSALIPGVNSSYSNRRVFFDAHPEGFGHPLGQWLDRQHFMGSGPEVVYFAFGEPPTEPNGDLVSPFNFEVWMSIPVAILALSLVTTTMSLVTSPGRKTPAIALRTLSASIKTFTVHLIDQSIDTSKSIIWQQKSRHVAMLLNVLLVSWIFVALLINNGYKSFAKATLGFRHPITFDARWPSFVNYSLFQFVDEDQCEESMDVIHMRNTFRPADGMYRRDYDPEVAVYFNDLYQKLQACQWVRDGTNSAFADRCEKEYALFRPIIVTLDFLCLKHLKLYTEKLFLEPPPEVPEWKLQNEDIPAIIESLRNDDQLKYIDYEYAEAKYWNMMKKDKAFVVNDYMYERTWNDVQKLMKQDPRVVYHHLNKLSSRFTAEVAGAPSFYLSSNVKFRSEQNAYVLDRAKILLSSGILGFMEFWNRRWARLPPANVSTGEEEQLKAQAMNLSNSDFGKIMGILGAGLVVSFLAFMSEIVRILKFKK